MFIVGQVQPAAGVVTGAIVGAVGGITCAIVKIRQVQMYHWVSKGEDLGVWEATKRFILPALTVGCAVGAVLGALIAKVTSFASNAL